MTFLTLALPCTENELKAAFRDAAKRLHPDVGGDPKLFVALTAEYQRLRADPHTFADAPRNLYTSDGFLLSGLGLGLGPLENGRPCAACKSQGYRRVNDAEVSACPSCGTSRWNRARSWLRFLCRECGGRGWISRPTVRYERCWECRGTGEILIFNPALPKGRLKGRL